MRKLFIFVTFSIFFVIGFSQSRVSTAYYPYSDGKKWGFVNSNNEIVIEAKFDSVYFPVNKKKLFIALNDGKLALLNSTGKVLTRFEFDDINLKEIDENPLIKVRKGNLYGIIDSTGKIIHPAYFDRIEYFDQRFETVKVEKDNKWGMMNKSGKIVLKPQFDYISEFDVNGIAIARKGTKYCHANHKGKLLYEPKFEYLTNYKGKKELYATAKLNGKYGIIDIKGRTVIPHVYESIQYQGEEELYASARLNGKYGIVDVKGKTVIPHVYDWIVYQGIDNEGQPYFLYTEGSKVHYINLNNKILSFSGNNEEEIILEEEFIETENIVDNKTDKRIDYSTGNIVIEKDTITLDIKKSRDLSTEIFKLKNIYDTIFWLNKAPKYTNFNDFILVVYDNGRLGLINVFGEVIVPIEYDNYRNFHFNYVFEKGGNESYFSVYEKKFIYDPEYVYFKAIMYGRFGLIYFLVKRDDGFWGYIRSDGTSCFPKR